MKQLMIYWVLSANVFILGLFGGHHLYTQDFGQVDLITSVAVTKNRVDITVNEDFKQAYLRDNFFAEYDEDIDLTQLDESIVVMPFIMNVVSIVWISGKDYYIDAMDEDLYYSLEKIREFFRAMYSDTAWEGNLIPRKLVNNKRKTNINRVDESHSIAMLFSYGLDSFCSSLRHDDKQQLLISAWGHSDAPLGEDTLWAVLKKKIISFAQKHGHTNSFIRSNYYDFLNLKTLAKLTPEISHWRVGAVEGLGWAGLAAPILVTKEHSIMMISSTITWDYPYQYGATPCIDDNIRFAGIKIRHDDFDSSRPEKCEFLGNFCRERVIEKPFVRVCQKNIKSLENCCICEKCIRTINGFIAAGEDYREYGFNISYKEVERITKKIIAIW